MEKLRNPWTLLIVFCSVLFINTYYSNIYAISIIQEGSKGREVIELQDYLYQLNYLRQRATGYYGKMTTEAVKSFQLEHDLKPDGKVGQDTMEALSAAVNEKLTVVEHIVLPNETLDNLAKQFNSSDIAIMIKNRLSSNELVPGQRLVIPVGGSITKIASRNRSGGVQMIPWSIVNQLWKVGETATIIDVETYKHFRVRRLSGVYHADAEPLTKHDTEIMKDIYAGQWSWARRAVVVHIYNFFIAASINGMPHGYKSIIGNNFPGEFCTHFLGSRVHQSGMVDPEHLVMIEKASKFDLNSFYRINNIETTD